jgi:hypothetical protein
MITEKQKIEAEKAREKASNLIYQIINPKTMKIGCVNGVYS